MSRLTWDDVLMRHDIVGGDIESHEEGSVFRGPIAEIRQDGDQIIFTMQWLARMSVSEGKMWEKWDTTTMSVNKTLVSLSDIGDGRIAWSVQLLGTFVIFPKGGSKLDPRKVKGLEAQEIV